MALMSLLLSVATSVLKSGWCVELLLETSTDECGLRGSGRVLRFSDSACNREMGVFVLLVEIANIIRASLSRRERCNQEIGFVRQSRSLGRALEQVEVCVYTVRAVAKVPVVHYSVLSTE